MPESSRPNPLHCSWFAVWRWPRWTYRLLIVSIVFGYIVSGPPTFYLMRRNRQPSQVEDVAIGLFYTPVNVYAEAIPPLKRFLDWETDTIRWLDSKPPLVRD